MSYKISNKVRAHPVYFLRYFAWAHLVYFLRYFALDGDADHAVDGMRNSEFNDGSCTHTIEDTDPTWWLVDLGEESVISSIIITSRNSGGKGIVLLTALF